MNDVEKITAQVRELEIKVAFLERHLEAQDHEMLKQSRQLDLLKNEVKRLRDISANNEADGPPANEKPPHY